MINLRVAWALVAALGFSLAGCDCAQRITVTDGSCHKDADLIQTTYRAVDCLVSKTGADPSRRVLVATVVNLDNVKDTSTFGRLLGEFLAARLTHHGHPVVHMTVRQGSVLIKPEGEFLLSRDMRELARDYDAQAVLVSTYTVSSDKVFVSIKLVRAEDSTITAAIDFAVPKGPRTTELLGSTTGESPTVDVGTPRSDSYYRRR